MENFKKLKSFDLESLTIIGTSIEFIWGIIAAIAFLIYLIVGTGVINGSIFIMAIAIAFLILITSIPKIFASGSLYNYLINRLMDVKVKIIDMAEVTNVSIIPTATIVAIITVILYVIVYPIIFVIISTMLPILSLFGMDALALTIVSPLSIVYAFVLPFFLTIVALFVFNNVAPRIGGIKVSLAVEGDKVALNNVNPVSAGINAGIISLVLELAIGLVISIAIIGNLPASLTLIGVLAISGLVGGFISGVVSSFLYNVLVKKLGPVKLGLEDSE